MDERKRRQDLLKQFDRIAAVEQRGVRRQAEPIMVTTHQIELEGMKCPDPEFGRSLRQSARQALRKLDSGPVREGEDEHRRRVDSTRRQLGHELDEGTRLSSEAHTYEPHDI